MNAKLVFVLEGPENAFPGTKADIWPLQGTIKSDMEVIRWDVYALVAKTTFLASTVPLSVLRVQFPVLAGEMERTGV